MHPHPESKVETFWLEHVPPKGGEHSQEEQTRWSSKDV